MRHIPEAELHAYLDQALSRSQCVEIERHLAECAACHAARDEIAGLRDRTTALLAQLAPAAARVPPFASVRDRAAGTLPAQRRRRQRIAWAASVVGGIGLGWVAAMTFGSGRGVGRAATVASTAVPAAATPIPAPADTAPAMALPLAAPVAGTSVKASAAPVAVHQQRTPKSRLSASRSPETVPPAATAPRSPSPRAGATAPTINDSTPATLASATARHTGMTDSVHPVGDLVLSGPWKTVSWDSARAEAGGKTPSHIDGLPVVQVQVQKNPAGTQPTMVVAQQLASGEVIRTVDGPAANVSRLFGRRVMTDPVADSGAVPDERITGPTAGAGQSGGHQSMALRQGDHIVAITGALSPDSLRAMMHRLHGGQVGQEPRPALAIPSDQSPENGRVTPAGSGQGTAGLSPTHLKPLPPR